MSPEGTRRHTGAGLTSLASTAMANACTNLTSATRLRRLLRIQGFSATASMDGQLFIASRWNVGGHDWVIRIYHAYKVSAVLQLINSPKGATTSICRASLACHVIDPTAKHMPSQEKSLSDNFYQSHVSKHLMLMSRDELASSGYLEDDTLTLQCTITVLQVLPEPTIPAEEAPTIPAEEVIVMPPPTNLHQHLGELLRSEAGADVTFLVCGESFVAHKNILAARSPVFKAEFFGGMKEKCSQCVEIKDMEAATFRAMLHFIYTDRVPELDHPLEELAVTTMAQHLLAGADRYGLDRLKLICEIKLANGITTSTAATTLALAEQHNFSQLKAKCVEFIVSTPAVLDAVLETEGYEHLAASCPSTLADLLKCARGRKH